VSFTLKEISVPNPVTSNYLKDAFYTYDKRKDRIHPSVSGALKNVYAALTPSYSLDSKPGLRKLITDQLDPAFGHWLAELGYKQKSFVHYLENYTIGSSSTDFSELSTYDLPNYPEANIDGEIDLKWINRGWRLRTYPQLTLENLTIDDFCGSHRSKLHYETVASEVHSEVDRNSQTTDALLGFLFLCKRLCPEPTYLANTKRDDSGDLYLEDDKLQRKRRPRPAQRMQRTDISEPLYLRFGLSGGYGICWACDLPTEEASKLNFLKTAKDLSRAEKATLGQITALRGKKGYSDHHCAHHSDVTNRAGYRKALRDRANFLWLLAALRHDLCRADVDLIGYEHWRRFAALCLEDGRSKRKQKHIHEIARLTPMLYEGDWEHPQIKSLAGLILAHLRELYSLLQLTEEQEFSNNLPCLKSRKIKTLRKSRHLKLRASVPPTAPAP
jgi:hypothetical protein